MRRYGFDATEKWCQFNNASPWVAVRPLGGKSVHELETELTTAGVQTRASSVVSGALLLAPGSLGLLPPALRDSLRIQDEGSQLVAAAAGARPGERLLDLCAAPGGKTILLTEAVGSTGLVIAADFRRSRVALLHRQLERAGIDVPLLQVDATQPLPFREAFDRVVVDAPCSGLGTLRRDPDLKWSRQESDLAAFASAQFRILTNAADAVRPGGTLLYATCSSEPEENDAVVDAFTSSDSRFHVDEVRRTRPDRDALDAFYAARLVRPLTA
jgi:16S rRNA (cytosine967-C5)-methyltransferase